MCRILLVGLLLASGPGCDDKKGLAPKAGGAGQERGVPDAKGEAPARDGAQLERKIIYTARVELHVNNLDEARKQVDALLVAAQGYVAKSDEAGRTGGTRRGSWRLRVPVAKFHDFLARVEAVGELVSKSSDAQDVTEEVIDAEARLKNLKSEEGVLN